jgi:hypothetical protein
MYIRGNFKVTVENKINARVKTRLRLVGELVVKRAKQFVPYKTGRLKKSIHYVLYKNRVDIVADARIHGDSSKPSYAYFVETGQGNGAAQPFLRPALHGAYTSGAIKKIMTGKNS